MSRHVVVAGLVMVLCCTVVLAQDGSGVPPRVGATTRAIDLARAAQRANAELAGEPIDEAETVAQADTGSTDEDADEAAADSADESEDERKPDADKPKPKKKRGGGGGSGFIRDVAETLAIALVTAAILIAVVVS